MNHTLRSPIALLTFLIGFVIFTSCKKEASPEAKEAFSNSIPRPAVLEPGTASFVVTSETSVFADKSTQGVGDVSEFLATSLGIKQAESRGGDNQVYLSIVNDGELGDEGYEITITGESISVTANKPAGLFYATQTLRQIGVKNAEGTEFASGKIRDYPNFGWRGSMLDVARHFFGVSDVKRYIDLMAFYKLNVLHLSLTNDQGWRIEIKSRPDLTAIGGKTQVGGNGGGFYTQEDYKEIVSYAQKNFITIVPEVDLPGHTNAALASYPELNKDGKATALYEGIEVGFSTLSRHTPAQEKITLDFVNDVVRELAQITPGPYIHIGGDEAAATKKPDYLEFIKAFKKIVEANGKHMIGWEEIAQSDIGPGDIAQYWHSKEHSATAVQKGAKLLLSPANKIYLDMKYDSTTKLGQSWAALIEVDDAYNWKPEELISGVGLENVVGIEAPIWTETLSTMDHLEYMLFPRLPGIAEIAWSKGERNWEEYKHRLGHHGKVMEQLGIDYYKSPKVSWE
jgi:hexosaminidase